MKSKFTHEERKAILDHFNGVFMGFEPQDFRTVRIVVRRRLDTLGVAYSLLGGVNR